MPDEAVNIISVCHCVSWTQRERERDRERETGEAPTRVSGLEEVKGGRGVRVSLHCLKNRHLRLASGFLLSTVVGSLGSVETVDQ